MSKHPGHPQAPLNEPSRLAALLAFELLDTPAEAMFDNITTLAAHICNTPIALISLIDAERQWFKSRVGLGVSETPRELAFCAHAINRDELFEIENALLDPRFCDNPLVTSDPDIRFYAGMPLSDGHGHNLGTLCVIDRQPRQLNEQQRQSLKLLAQQTVQLFELRLQSRHQREQAAVHKAILGSAGTAVLVVDPAGLIQQASPGVATLLGYNADGLLGRELELLLPRNGRQLTRDALSSIPAQGSSQGQLHEVQMRHASGHTVPVLLNLSPVSLEDKFDLGYLCIVHDLSYREEALQRLQRLSAQLPGVVYQFQLLEDGRSCFPYASQGIESIYGLTPEAVAKDATAVYALIDPDDLQGVSDSIATSAANLELWHQEYRVLHPTKGLIWVEGRAAPQRGADGSVMWHGFISDITERKSAEQKIQHLAFYDPLTNLPNRRLLRDRLQQAIALCGRKGMYGALIFLDLDDFKNVNDLYGHQVGDELLCQVAKRLTETLREQDTVARLGGDEFVILLEGLESCAEEAGTQVEHIGIKLLQALREPYLVSGHRFNNSASLGIVMFNDAHHSVDELMQHAELSMYSSKALGKNALSFYDPQMQAVVSKRLQLEEDIRRGLAEEEFVIYLQPQAGVNGYLEGAEALVRWQHPQRGVLGPGVFIEIAERSDLIEVMDLATLRQGCELLARWSNQPQRAALSLSVNISSRLLYRDDFIDLIKHLLDETQANPLRLKLEITESLLLTDKEKAVMRMQSLREMGIRFSIDDFGTGYSSMAYLQQLPLDQLKIDQSFVRDLPENTSGLAIVRAILAMAHSLNLEVIAEGVETLAQRDALSDSGCKHFQGYLFGKPVAVADFEVISLCSGSQH